MRKADDSEGVMNNFGSFMNKIVKEVGTRFVFEPSFPRGKERG
jgi:hypothetical protein